MSAGNADADAKNADLESKLANLEDEIAKLRKELEVSESDKTELQQQLFQVKIFHPRLNNLSDFGDKKT